MPEASEEIERSYIFKTNSLLVNVGTALDDKIVGIKVINDYSCGQEEILDYSSQKAECLAQLKMKASNKEDLL